MGSYTEEEADRFFDAREEISSLSDGVSDCSEESCSNDRFDLVNDYLDNLQYKVWCRSPESVNERRRRFQRCLGLGLEQDFDFKKDEGDSPSDEIQLGIDRITQDGGAVLRTSNFEHEFFSSQSLFSTWADDAEEPRENHALDDDIGHAVNNLDGGMDERGCDGILHCSQGAFSNQSVSSEEHNKMTLLSSSLDKQLLHAEVNNEKPLVVPKKVKQSWLRKLGVMAHLVDHHGEDMLKTSSDNESTSKARMKRLRIHTYSKRSKELSSLYPGQEFVAHDGSISTMKFSLDGQYLASAGKDCIVRVWKVIEDERIDSFDTQCNDPSCLYFKMNHLSQLVPLNVGKGEVDKMPRPWIPADSTCVIFPPNGFQILEKPAHEFHGHSGEILDLSWSKRGSLLSSSVDKTVRLWKVGDERCLRVFSHNNYVTSVAFNPVDDNYFISGSIDGKVRIWEVFHCKVVDYTDVRDIVTAVSYRPDGKGGMVGSMIGNCRFYEIIDNQLRLEAEICLQGKKKLSGKRITGFQFSTTDPSKVIVTSADSLVRVLSGVDVVCKFKASGFRIAASQMFATFTQDGKHVISASEDSKVYIWNYTNQDKNSSRTKKIWSCESFLSHNVSVAIPWCGVETMPGSLPSSTLSENVRRNSFINQQKHQNPKADLEQKMSHSSPDCLSLTRHLLESLMKGPMTWPEEALPNSSPAKITPEMCKSKLKILKNACQSKLSSPHLWGLAIVAATWDGKIRTYCNYGLPIRI
ncbi:hypothetical protein SLEP1_g16202 [Rubroshorea leprosula]|uniref:Uncharacterized protein n=2 Tax=Rubroshorea leprosula TaxID=152421 RepID=A0AAV5IXR7_9ROSI|nr:hypothetical protein SLEP1_g16202 [Rubroshorea leprosula]